MQFRGASAEAVASLVEKVTEAASRAPGQASTMADDLFTVAATFRSEGALRRFATDASLPSEAKSGMVREVFGGRVSEPTLALLADAVTHRWTSAGDLGYGLEHLGVVATVRSAEDAGRLSDELFEVTQTVKQNPSLRDELSDPARSVEDKSVLVRGLLEGRALEATVKLTVQALAGTHRTVVAALAEYQKVAADVHGENVATVRVARSLSEQEEQRLQAVLRQQYDRPVHLNLVVDPDLLGGIRVEIGDDVIDGTVASRLADARRRLAGTAG